MGLLFTLSLYVWVARRPTGNEKMTAVASAIAEGSMTFLTKEYSILALFLAVVTALVAIFLGVPSGRLLPHRGRLFHVLRIRRDAICRQGQCTNGPGRPRGRSLPGPLHGLLWRKRHGMWSARPACLSLSLLLSWLWSMGSLEAIEVFAMGHPPSPCFARVGEESTPRPPMWGPT